MKDNSSTAETERRLASIQSKLKSLPPAAVDEVERFIDVSLKFAGRSGESAQSWFALSEPALNEVWDNPEDAAYDRL